MFKKILLLYAIITCSFYHSFSQLTSNFELGKWQIGSPKIAAGYSDSYSFYKGGKFKFSTDENYGLRRFEGFTGRYQVQNDSLILILSSMTEYSGGNLELSEIQGGSGWTFTHTKKITSKINKNIKEYLTIRGPFIKNNSCYKLCTIFHK
ncbi:MAG: hypothetical protein WCG87_11280 [Bacteroidota bacterium]